MFRTVIDKNENTMKELVSDLDKAKYILKNYVEIRKAPFPYFGDDVDKVLLNEDVYFPGPILEGAMGLRSLQNPSISYFIAMTQGRSADKITTHHLEHDTSSDDKPPTKKVVLVNDDFNHYDVIIVTQIKNNKKGNKEVHHVNFDIYDSNHNLLMSNGRKTTYIRVLRKVLGVEKGQQMKYVMTYKPKEKTSFDNNLENDCGYHSYETIMQIGDHRLTGNKSVRHFVLSDYR